MDLLEDGVDSVFRFSIEDREIDLQSGGRFSFRVAFGRELTPASSRPWDAILGKIKPEDPELFGALVKATEIRASHDRFNSFHTMRLPWPAA